MPAQINRSDVVRGPGTVKLGAVQFFDKEGIKADLNVETYEVTSSAFGRLDTRRKDRTGKVTFKPCGNLTAPILAALYPYGSPSIGSSLCGAADTACIVHSTLGTKVTFFSAALTKMPSLKLNVGETPFSSDAEITCINKNNTPVTDAASFWAVATEQWAGAFNVSDIKGGVYLGTLGTGESAVTFQTFDGWSIDFDQQNSSQSADGVGTCDIILGDVGCRAKCRPLGISEATLLGYLNLQGATAGLGASMLSGKDLVISCATGLTVTLKEVAMVQGPMAWGKETLRIDEIGFIANRAIVNGVPGALFSVALSA